MKSNNSEQITSNKGRGVEPERKGSGEQRKDSGQRHFSLFTSHFSFVYLSFFVFIFSLFICNCNHGDTSGADKTTTYGRPGDESYSTGDGNVFAERMEFFKGVWSAGC